MLPFFSDGFPQNRITLHRWLEHTSLQPRHVRDCVQVASIDRYLLISPHNRSSERRSSLVSFCGI